MKFKFKPGDWEVISYSRKTPLGSILRYGLIKDSPGPDKGRRFAHFCFVYTLAGETPYQDEEIGEHLLKPGDLLLLHPGVAHRYGNRVTGGWDEYFLVFEGPVFDLWKSKGLLKPENPIINLQPVAYWHRRLAACAEGLETADLSTHVKRLITLQAFIGDLLEAQLSDDQHQAKPWLSAACLRLESNLGEAVDWNDISRSVGLSFENFRKLFTRTMGVSPGRYRAAKVIDRACYLITREKKITKEVAHELGFANAQHFSKRFRQITGLTPTEFRKQWIIKPSLHLE